MVGLCAAIVLVAAASCARSTPACDEDVRREAWEAAQQSCERAYRRDRAPRAGRQLATAHLQRGDLDRGEAIATELLDTEESPAARLLLGDIARSRAAGDAALDQFSQALAEYTTRGDESGRARAAYQLAGTAKELGRYNLAVDAQRIASEAARRAGDSRMAMYANLAGAIILRATGDMVGAEQAMARALAAATNPRDRAWVKLTQGTSYLDAGLDALAGPPLRDVLALSDEPALVSAARLNLAFLARQGGQLDAALGELRLAERSGADQFDVDLLYAQISVDRGHHPDAARRLAVLAAKPLQDRWTWVVPLWQGRNEEARGDMVAAERHYRVALAAAEQLRARAGRLEPHVLAKHREVYERLIGLLARARRWPDAVLVIARLDAGSLSRGLLPDNVAVILDAWRGRELVIVVRGGANAWRLHVRDGAVQGTDLGPFDAIERNAAHLLAMPDDRERAGSLGAALLGTSHGTGALHVLLVGTISNAPLAALRIEDTLAVARRPLIRVLGITPRPRRVERHAGSIVLGDPRGNLPGAASEAREVATLLGVEPILGAAAKRAAITGARAKLLHVASHAESSPDGSKLLLADGALDVGELIAIAEPPHIVVLASCGSAAASDLGGWGSLASAFLGAGSDIVIATSWTIRDEAAARVVGELYRQGVLNDPAAALARTQHLLAARGETATREWAAFNAIGAPPAR